MDRKYVPAIGPRGAKLMILGESPGHEELKNGIPFCGPSGKELDRLLQDSGISRNDCWVSNVCKYFVPFNEKGDKIPFQVRASRASIDLVKELEDLQTEINEIKPNCILALGGTALWAITGKTKISNFRGSILHGRGIKTVGTYHPAHLLHQSIGSEIKGYWNRQVMVFDFKRAKAQSAFPELRLPQRNLEICRSSYQLYEFLSQYKSKIPSVDIEAGGHCLPICIGIAFNPNHGMCIPLWNKDGISSIPDSDLTQIWLLLADFLAKVEGVIGQNFNYDRDKLLRLGFTVKRILSDCMYKSFAINPELPKGLAFNTSIYTEEPYYKDEGMYEGSLNDLFIGCSRDACVTYEINTNMDSDLDEIGQRKYYENYLMKLPDMYWNIEKQGVGLDDVARDRLIRKYIEWDERLRYRLYKLVGAEINCNSWQQVGTLLFDNLKLPRKLNTGEEALTELINSPTVRNKGEEVIEILENILENRRVRKSISTYLMALPDFDGRMRTTYFPCLETGRSSTGQQDPPIRPKIEVRDEEGKKKKKVMGIAFQTITKHGDVGNDIREMMVP